MVKKTELIVVLIFVILLASLNLFFFFGKGNFSYSNLPISGLVSINFAEIRGSLDTATIVFIIQWIILLLILLIAFARYLKREKEEKVQIHYNQIKDKQSKSSTDLDVLYNILKERKKLRISIIAKTFKITNEKALEWAKILENQELAMLEYPTFGEPIIEIKQKEVEHEKEKEGQASESEKEKIEAEKGIEKKVREIKKEKAREKRKRKKK